MTVLAQKLHYVIGDRPRRKLAENLFTSLNLKRNVAFRALTLDQVKDGIIDHDLLGFCLKSMIRTTVYTVWTIAFHSWLIFAYIGTQGCKMIPNIAG